MSDNRSRPVGATGVGNARLYGLKSSEGILLAQVFHVFGASLCQNNILPGIKCSTALQL